MSYFLVINDADLLAKSGAERDKALFIVINVGFLKKQFYNTGNSVSS
jgi:hypothetical protein